MTTAGKKILILGAHLDDSVIAMGGTIGKLVEAGCEVHVFCFGNGDEAYTVPGGSVAAVERFKRNAEAAHRLLGVKALECLDVPDFAVDATRDFYQQCIRAIRKYQPEVVFGHYWAEYFQHHGMAQMSLDAWNQARWNCSADFGRTPWTVNKYYHFEICDLLPQPTHLIDVTATFEAKIAAMHCFDDDDGHLDNWSDEMTARARYYGAKIGVKYAEAFRRSFYIPEKVTHITEVL